MSAQICIVDLATGTSLRRQPSDPLAGGRLLSAELVSEFVDPATDPLGPGNILALACGPLAGRRISTGGRLSVGGKSPLTGGIKEANAGGMAGDSLAALGYRALVFRNAAPADAPVLCIVDEEGARLADARPFWGLDNEALAAAIAASFGADYVVAGIGRAGERRCRAAGVAISDAQGRPFRLATRGGLGAVMGSKGLKAVVVRRAPSGAKIQGGADARSAALAFHKLVATSTRTQVLRDYGTADTLMFTDTLGGLPTRNFSAGRFEGAEGLSAETLRSLIQTRGGAGETSHACMAGCVIQCSNVVPDIAGELAVSPLEFETLGLCGSNLGISSLDEVARINRLCNDLGLDTIEIGAALGVMMEAAENGTAPAGVELGDLPRFGDGRRAAELVAEIGESTQLGMLLGQGVVAVGRALGAQRVPAVKGQAMSAYDPRVVKGTGVTYATSPQGADHTAGLTVFAPVDHLDPARAVALSRGSQIQRAAYDALGLCVFNIGASGGKPEIVRAMLETAYGVTLPANTLDQLGRRVIDLERDFNRKAGFTSADDRLPAFFLDERLDSTGSRFDVNPEEIDSYLGLTVGWSSTSRQMTFNQAGRRASERLDDVHTIAEIWARLGLGRSSGLVVIVNGRLANWSTELQDGDVVQLRRAPGGG